MATERLETILAQARQLSAAELAQLIKHATELLIQSRKHASQPASSYASLFGSGKGSFKTREEADRTVREERDAWAMDDSMRTSNTRLQKKIRKQAGASRPS